MNKNAKALQQYKKVGKESDAAFASPHRLIQMLFEGALEKISIARGHMERGDIAGKGQNIGWAISIVEGLRTSLDKSSGGEVAENLDALYEYVEHRLTEANLDNNIEYLDESSKLLKTIKSAWDEIASEADSVRPQVDNTIVSATVS
ncbi:MAG: flagellar export chaperone FliS [Gammaproteobacteria bacterium]|nr:flagellar export chaperone FliS [Gammaproteobacteria bacterium]